MADGGGPNQGHSPGAGGRQVEGEEATGFHARVQAGVTAVVQRPSAAFGPMNRNTALPSVLAEFQHRIRHPRDSCPIMLNSLKSEIRN